MEKVINDFNSKEMRELDYIWKDIDEGMGVSLNKVDLLKEMELW